ncbi:MAG TPA: hypothetical protein VJ689_07810, partial [Gaiellaceae bacterium]|nr:hypothetical protein [Gaiellaceae bacterium]
MPRVVGGTKGGARPAAQWWVDRVVGDRVAEVVRGRSRSGARPGSVGLWAVGVGGAVVRGRGRWGCGR